MDNYKFTTIMYVDSDGLFENALENLVKFEDNRGKKRKICRG